jgi:AcrR family transcriptional regulator
MRVSREKAEENRERILKAASRLFRERGIEAAGVHDVTRAAGLTQGGFYRHFDSKEGLVAEAVEQVRRVDQRMVETCRRTHCRGGAESASDQIFVAEAPRFSGPGLPAIRTRQ